MPNSPDSSTVPNSAINPLELAAKQALAHGVPPDFEANQKRLATLNRLSAESRPIVDRLLARSADIADRLAPYGLSFLQKRAAEVRNLLWKDVLTYAQYTLVRRGKDDLMFFGGNLGDLDPLAINIQLDGKEYAVRTSTGFQTGEKVSPINHHAPGFVINPDGAVVIGGQAWTPFEVLTTILGNNNTNTEQRRPNYNVIMKTNDTRLEVDLPLRNSEGKWVIVTGLTSEQLARLQATLIQHLNPRRPYPNENDDPNSLAGHEQSARERGQSAHYDRTKKLAKEERARDPNP